MHITPANRALYLEQILEGLTTAETLMAEICALFETPDAIPIDIRHAMHRIHHGVGKLRTEAETLTHTNAPLSPALITWMGQQDLVLTDLERVLRTT